MSPSSDAHGDLALRAATAADAPAIITLVDSVYREYGDRVCLDDADRDLLTAHEHYARLGGEFIVLADANRVWGIHAVVPLVEKPATCTFRRLYLDSSLRGTGWGERLMQWALERGRALGYQRVEFWSDTRFTRAHRFFARLGFQWDGRIRTMHDAWEPYEEFFFFRHL